MNRRRVIYVLVLLGAVGALVAAVRWHAVGGQPPALPLASTLQRRVASIHLDAVPARDALAKVQELTGVKISPRWGVLKAHNVEPDTDVWLNAEDVTVEQVMQALTDQLRGYEAAAGYEIQGDTIVVAPDIALPHAVRVYDVADFLRESFSHPPAGEIAGAIRCYLEPRYSRCGVVVAAQEEWLHENSGRLIVEQSSVVHTQLAEFFDAARHAQPDGTGPVIHRARVMHEKSYRTVLCFYDVRDLARRAELTIPAVLTADGKVQYPSEEIRGARVLAELLQKTAAHQRWKYCDDSGTVYPMCGRLVVEQTPENQKDVREFLRNLRCGAWKPIPGFRMKAVEGKR